MMQKKLVHTELAFLFIKNLFAQNNYDIKKHSLKESVFAQLIFLNYLYQPNSFSTSGA